MFCIVVGWCISCKFVKKSILTFFFKFLAHCKPLVKSFIFISLSFHFDQGTFTYKCFYFDHMKMRFCFIISSNTTNSSRQVVDFYAVIELWVCLLKPTTHFYLQFINVLTHIKECFCCKRLLICKVCASRQM